jgi:Pro-kumamolisin, activation domain/Bacterial Ig-like domain (group 3)
MEACSSLSLVLRSVAVLSVVLALASPLPAQQSTPVLVTQAVDNAVRTTLPGNVHPLARAEFDRGEAPPDVPLKRMLLVLKRSSEQETSLRRIIDDQQDKNSPNYHQWLTPAEFGARFGPADSDIAALTNWLTAGGFEVTAVSTGRTAIEFSGTAGLVKQAFGTEIHKYVDAGEQHWANTSNPSIPTALVPVVHGVMSLNSFPRKPHHTVLGPVTPDHREKVAPLPLFTFKYQGINLYGVGPGDFATIYNIPSAMDGTGQHIAIVGESNINIQDIRDFRRIFGLPARDPHVILNGPDPGLQFDETEAVLDVSWSGAVARNATIDFVVSASTETTPGIDLSALYIVDNNVAPVMSESYGACERFLGNTANAFYNALWQQAAAQGITVLISSGDGGSAGCDDFNNASVAQFGLAMNGLASTPYNVAVGGTDFDQTPQNAVNYWNSSNNANTGASAKSYIRETPWNDSCAGSEFGVNGCVPNNFNFLDIVGGSGGPSNCAFQDDSGTCLGGYDKPAWQTGTGVRLDGVRDTPDVSLFASNGFNGSFYILCEADILQGFPCSIGANNFAFLPVGGTSASAPAFAGIMALVNQKTGGRQGNANYVLYKLAAQPGASCDSTALTQAQLTNNSCVFYDTTKGNNSVPCLSGSPDCGAAPPGGYGVLVDPGDHTTPAWKTTKGYDMATGLGSVNVTNLVNKWSTATFAASTTTVTNLTPASLTHGDAVDVSITVAPKSGTGTPTGSVALMAKVNNQNLAVDSLPLNNGVATGTTHLLPGGSYNLTAHYTGDGVFGASDSTGVPITVGKENSQTAITLLDQNLNHVTNPTYGSLYFLRGDVTNATGRPCNAPPGQLACPSGAVTLTDNGNPLDAGSYALNSQGYFDDYVIQLGGGNNTIQSQYSGDTSFHPSTSIQTVTVNPALISIYSVSGVPQPATVDQPFIVTAAFSTPSYGRSPSGTVTFLMDGNSLPGTVQLTPHDGNYPDRASLNASLTVTINTPGFHSLTATYSGDSNYTNATTQAPVVTDVLYTPVYFTLTANPQQVAYGDNMTLTAVVGGNSRTVAPTGQIEFVAAGSISATTYSTITDDNGNLARQAVVSFTPSAVQNATATYYGDVNYARSHSNPVAIVITDATFSISPITNVSISAGQTGLANVTLNPANGFNSAVSITCTLPPTMKEASCPQASVFVNPTGSTFVQINITTTAPHHVTGMHSAPTGTYALGIFAGIFLSAIPGLRRRRLPIVFLLLMLVALIVSCGGGGGGGDGGHTDPGTSPGTYTVNLTATGLGVTQTASFSVTVQ